MAKFKIGDIVKVIKLDGDDDKWVELGMQFEVLDEHGTPDCKGLSNGAITPLYEWQLELVEPVQMEIFKNETGYLIAKGEVKLSLTTDECHQLMAKVRNDRLEPRMNLEQALEYETKCVNNRKSAEAFGITSKKYGKTSALTRISDKFNRLENLMLNDTQLVKDESVKDTLLDLANYCIMTVMELEK